MTTRDAQPRIVVVGPEELLLVPANPRRTDLIVSNHSAGVLLVYFTPGAWDGLQTRALVQYSACDFTGFGVIYRGDVYVRRGAGDGQVGVLELSA